MPAVAFKSLFSKMPVKAKKPRKAPKPKEANRFRHYGRPSKFSRELADLICQKLSDGESLVDICKDEGMPGRTTVMGWLDDEDKIDFRNMYARAREAQADFHFSRILKVADDGANDTYTDADGNTRTDYDVIARSKLRVDALKWVASKLAPRKYGDRILQEHTGADGGPLEVHTFNIPENGR